MDLRIRLSEAGSGDFLWYKKVLHTFPYRISSPRGCARPAKKKVSSALAIIKMGVESECEAP